VSGDLHVLDVGHGNCAIARGDGWSVMVDAAPSSAVVETLEHFELSRLDVIAISHRDADHARGLGPLLASTDLEIGTIYISADAAKDPTAPDTAMLLAALRDAKESGRCEVSKDLDDALPTGTLDGGGLTVEVLAPTFETGMTGPLGVNAAGSVMTSNTVSAVLRITLPDGLRVLLPGDIDDVAFAELRERGPDLSADVLVFPHHGSLSTVEDEEAFARGVVEAVGPHTVLFSVGRGRRVRPTESIMRGVLEARPDLYIACTQLSSGCVAADATLQHQAALTHLSSVPAAGGARCRSCAGSMVLRGAGLSESDRKAHQQYLTSAVDSPMCHLLRPQD
jgi:beta-lactamase superfamily II metal-dependent hydrolase